MKIAVSSTGKDLESQVDLRFGRCRYFMIVDPETMDFEAAENPGLEASGGAGVQATQFIVEMGANTLITGHLGPNAASALSASGVKVYHATGGTVREAIDAFKSGTLREAAGATVSPHFGMGGKGGMGRRRRL